MSSWYFFDTLLLSLMNLVQSLPYVQKILLNCMNPTHYLRESENNSLR